MAQEERRTGQVGLKELVQEDQDLMKVPQTGLDGPGAWRLPACVRIDLRESEGDLSDGDRLAPLDLARRDSGLPSGALAPTVPNGNNPPLTA